MLFRRFIGLMEDQIGLALLALIPRLGQKLFTAIGKECRFVQQYDPFTMESSVVRKENGTAAGKEDCEL